MEVQKAKGLAEIEVDCDLWKFSCSISGLCHILTVGLEQVYNRGYCPENNTLLKEFPLFSLYDNSVFDVNT